MQQCLQCDHCKYFSFVLIFDEKKSLAPNQQANGEMVSLRHKVLINSQIQKLPLLRSTTAKGKVFFYCSIQKYFLRHTRLPFFSIQGCFPICWDYCYSIFRLGISLSIAQAQKGPVSKVPHSHSPQSPVLFPFRN